MGLSLKKITKTVKNVVTKPAETLKKATNVAVAGVTGFAAGGPAGAVVAAGRQAVRESQTGKATALNLRSVGQSAVTGLAAGMVAKPVAAGLQKAGGLPGALKGGLSKVVAAGKSGGLAGNLGGVGKSLAGLAAKAGPAVAGLLKKGSGAIPGSGESADQVAEGQGAVDRSNLAGFRGVRGELGGYLKGFGRDAAAEVRAAAVGGASSVMERAFPETTTPVVVNNVPATPAVESPQSPLVPLALAAAGWFIFKGKA